ncbi:MAG: AmmeMemoRadiSam system protein B [Synergistaceae bacterium]|nr:AmmeMemoRadiSam system protein B [Synergistaceae bacterium]
MFIKFFTAALAVLLCFAPAGAWENVLTPFAGEMKPWSRGTPVMAFPGARAGIAPHHGLASETIARFYDNLSASGEIGRVILIGPDHFKAGRRPVTLCPIPWRAGNTILETDAGAIEALAREGGAAAEILPFRLEHSIGLHIVFIGRYFPNAKVAALMVKNNATTGELSKLVPALSGLLAEKGTILILSMDLSHEKLPAEAEREDDKSLERILSFSTENLRDLDIDARAATWLFLEALKHRGIKDGLILERTNSGEIISRPDLPCTSYATALFR